MRIVPRYNPIRGGSGGSDFEVPARPKRTGRVMKPGSAVVRYNDGSRYHLSRVMDVRQRAVSGSGSIIVRQALPRRARVGGCIEHIIPGHNVDVVTWRRRDIPEALIDHHAHCAWCGDHHPTDACNRAPWYVRAWAWFWQ